MNSNTRRLLVTLTLGLGLALALVWVLGGGTLDVVRAQSGTGVIRVATTGTDIPGCGSVISPCLTVQYAVDQALPGEEIRVAAGIYTGVQGRPAPFFYPGPSVITQVVYITKTVAVRGGYTTANGFADPPDPVANPTTLDAQGQGRVLAIFGNPLAPGGGINPTVEGLRITGGNAAGLGGDFQLPWGVRDAAGGVGVIAAMVTINNCQVSSNTAEVAGGIGLGFSAATLSGNIIAANTAITRTLSNCCGDGGGVGLAGSAATLIGNTIISNISHHDGGGMVTTGSDGVTLIGNTVISNTAYAGGGGLYMDTTTATLSSNTIVANASLDVGGGEGGGGLYLWNSDATLDGTIIISNTATWYGGAVFLGGDSGGSDATLINSVVADNRADFAGGGLYVEDSSLFLLHVTTARNTGGDGSGIYVTGYYAGAYSTVALTNTILVGHTVGITVAEGCTATLESTLWATGTPWANVIPWVNNGSFTHSNDFPGDPDFVDPDNGDYHIGPGSAAIDQGVNAGVTVDIDGDLRPFGAKPDLGADEAIAALSIAKTATPATGVAYHGEVTYTVVLSSDGASATGTFLTDTLPGEVDFDHWVVQNGANEAGDEITWSGTVTAGEAITFTFVVSHVGGYGDVVTNTARYSHITGSGSDNATFTVESTPPTYLPLVWKGFVSAPDLVVDSLVATSNAVTVTIRNQGGAPVVDAFWVDVYFNPSVTPSPNQPWDTIASHGAVWGVTDPIPAGGTLVLTTGGAYYFPEHSSTPPLPVGANVYALVDSVDHTTTYGAVPESDEGNNLFGPVVSVAGVAGAAATDTQGQSASRQGLPPR